MFDNIINNIVFLQMAELPTIPIIRISEERKPSVVVTVKPVSTCIDPLRPTIPDEGDRHTYFD